MTGNFYLNCFIFRFPTGWGAWVDNLNISTNKNYPIEDFAKDVLVEKIKNYSVNSQNPVTQPKIRWFDLNKDFGHCDLGFVYSDEENNWLLVTFLAYENGKAKVMYSKGEALIETIVEPSSIKPLRINSM